MTPFVLDNSVVMAWAFKDERNAYAESVLAALQRGSAVVPPIWPFEVVNVLRTAEKRKRLTRADAMGFIQLLEHLRIDVTEVSTMDSLFLLAMESDITSYDASYLMLALSEGIPLATSDAPLRRAAEAMGVKLFQPEPLEGEPDEQSNH